jgi:hypothetical protein
MNKKKNSTWRLGQVLSALVGFALRGPTFLVKALVHNQGGPASQPARARKFIPTTSGARVPLVGFTGRMPHPASVTYGWAPSVWFGTNLVKDSQVAAELRNLQISEAISDLGFLCRCV